MNPKDLKKKILITLTKNGNELSDDQLLAEGEKKGIDRRIVHQTLNLLALEPTITRRIERDTVYYKYRPKIKRQSPHIQHTRSIPYPTERNYGPPEWKISIVTVKSGNKKIHYFADEDLFWLSNKHQQLYYDDYKKYKEKNRDTNPK